MANAAHLYAGHRTQLTWPDGYTVTYGFDADNHMISATDSRGTPLAAYTYNALSRRTGLSYGDGSSVAYGYTAAGDLQSLAHRFPGTPAQDESYGFAYTPAHQLQTVTASNAAWQWQPGAAATDTYTAANPLNQYPGVNGAALSYDTNGKRIKTTLANGSVEYALYDLGGRLVYSEKGTVQTDYLDLAGQALAELVNGAPTYLHPDLLGSPRLATGSSQQILWREHFEPWGQKMNGVAEKIGYTGHAYDAETGLTYMQARYYDAQVGRFLSADPMPFSGSPFSFNRYAYANDNPYRFVDPTGLSAQCSTDSKSGTTTCLITPTGSHITRKATLTANQVRNITFNELRSLHAPGSPTGSGAGTEQAQTDIANEAINRFKSQADSASGEIKVGDCRDTACKELHGGRSAAEEGLLQRIGQTVTDVIAARASGNDPTQGATFYNFRDVNKFHGSFARLSTAIRQKPLQIPIPPRIQGPFDNSHPSEDLGPTGVYFVPYVDVGP